MRFICSITIVLAAAGGPFVTTANADDKPVRQAVARSIGWLEEDMQTWRKERDCAACHHGPMYLWSMGVARQQGYSINEPLYKELTRWLLTEDEARIFPKSESSLREPAKPETLPDRMTAAMMGHKNLSQPTIYMTHALNALADEDPLKAPGWKKVVDHLASAQIEDGSFAGRNAWRPIFNTPQVLTLFVASGLKDRQAANSGNKNYFVGPRCLWRNKRPTRLIRESCCGCLRNYPKRGEHRLPGAAILRVLSAGCLRCSAPTEAGHRPTTARVTLLPPGNLCGHCTARDFRPGNPPSSEPAPFLYAPSKRTEPGR
jgi:hypothetical protein